MAMTRRTETVFDTGWVVVTLRNRSQEQKRQVWEFEAPVPYRVYEKNLGGSRRARMEANVRLVRRVWRRSLHDSGEGEEEPEFELQPWIDVDSAGRCDLRIHLHGVARNVYLHDAAWYYFHNNGQFVSFVAFQGALRNEDGSRVDHCGGNPARLCVQKLRLQSAGRSASAGGEQRKLYMQTGVRVRTEKLLEGKTVRLPQQRSRRRPAARIAKRPAARTKRPAAAVRAKRPAAAARAQGFR